MIEFIPLDPNFLSDARTMRLKRMKGAEGVLCVIQLWSWAAANRPTGWISDLENEDIMCLLNTSDSGMLDALIHTNFIDNNNGLSIVDWPEVEK